LDEDLERSAVIGGGIGSKPVLVIGEGGEKLLISVGSTNPDQASQDTGAGVTTFDPLSGGSFIYEWWIEL
jgi:hypothetical protein